MVPTDIILEAFDQLQRHADAQSVQQVLQDLTRRSESVRLEMRV
jgi:hypothetical protein